MSKTATTLCKACHERGSGKYCSHCGQKLKVEKITVGYLIHEVFHLFTHLDKGFGYTLKSLVTSPGKMQREFIGGNRVNHQKPFSMYFICASLMAIGMYWINHAVAGIYHTGNPGEIMFFNKYLVMFLLASVPLTTFFTWLFFFNSGTGFAEIGIMQLYTLSVFFLMVMLLQGLKFIWPEMETRYLELPVILIYNSVTFVHFFTYQAKWKVIVKSVVCATLFFLCVTVVQDWIVEHYLN